MSRANHFISYALLLVVTLTWAISLAVMHLQQQNQINDIKRDLCAFIFEEDGSASIRTDDFDRAECRYE
jgi:hypothetical protein